VQAHVTNGQGPAIVSISDIHGYLDAARSALLTLSDHAYYEPVVTQGDDGLIHWAGNDYVLVFNGDLIDRGPRNVETLQMVSRLIDEAPTGRVRVTFGNYGMAVLTPVLLMWDSLFSGRVNPSGRRTLIQEILGGRAVAAYEGYNATYVHAGHSDNMQWGKPTTGSQPQHNRYMVSSEVARMRRSNSNSLKIIRSYWEWGNTTPKVLTRG